MLTTPPTSQSGCETLMNGGTLNVTRCLARGKTLQMFPLMMKMISFAALGMLSTVAALPRCSSKGNPALCSLLKEVALSNP